MVWLAAGVGALVASGIAAFTALHPAPAPPLPAGESSPIAQLATAESTAAAQAAFGEDPSESEEVPDSAQAEPGTLLPPTKAPPQHAGALGVAAAGEELGAADSDPVDVAPGIEPASVGAYYVQLASYHTKERADAQAAELKARGFKAQSAAYGGPEAGWWHAVRLGPFAERAEAEKQRFNLPIHERRSAYVLPRSNGKFHVQVASFAEKEEAEQVMKTFAAQGHSTKVTRVRMSGTYWYCVRIGPFDTREEAAAYKALVADIPGSESTVIPFAAPPASP